MNSLSAANGLRKASNPNSILSINRNAKNIYMDLSGTSYIDLSATSTYHLSAAGFNLDDASLNTSLALVKVDGRRLTTTDFSSKGSFSIYLKYAGTAQTFPPFNFLYPNMVNLSTTSTAVGQAFTAKFYSFLNPGMLIPYAISGFVSSDLNGAAVSGTFTAPFQEITYLVTAAPTGSVFFDVSGGLRKQLNVTT